ncbi:hypothetical protein D3C72_2049960 [compost metagenome]
MLGVTVVAVQGTEAGRGLLQHAAGGSLYMGEGTGEKQHEPERQQIPGESGMAAAHRLDHGVGFHIYCTLL